MNDTMMTSMEPGARNHDVIVTVVPAAVFFLLGSSEDAGGRRREDWKAIKATNKKASSLCLDHPCI